MKYEKKNHIVENLLDYWKSSKKITGVICFQYAEY